MIDLTAPIPFSDGFIYKDNRLTCNDVRMEEIAAKFGTPTYVYNLDAIANRYREWEQAFGEIPHQICYACKANSSLAILQHLRTSGCGLDVNSRGELFRAIKAGAPPNSITMTGVGKTSSDIEDALRMDILFLNVESLDECVLIDSIAKRMDQSARIVLRINPEVDAHTHPYIATGLAEHKFGSTSENAMEILRAIPSLRHTRLVGFGMHIGSQILDRDPFVEAFAKLHSFVSEISPLLREPISFINLGGGVGVPYSQYEHAVSIQQIIDALRPTMMKFQRDGILPTFVVEPGRHLVANAGILLTKVLYVKRTQDKIFIIVDAGMNDLIRPALYDAHHEIHPVVVERDRPTITADIVGPVCETGDYFALDRTTQEIHAGELLAIFSAGAYGAVMSSRYNSRPLAAEVVVRERKIFLARERESLEAMLSLEKMLSA